MTVSDNEQALVDWIVNTLGYPIDMLTDPPIPEQYRTAVVKAWMDRDRADIEEFDDYWSTCSEEGRWP